MADIRKSIQVQTVRRQPPLSSFKRTQTKLDQARFDDTAWGLSGIGDIMGEGSGNLGPLPDVGDLEVVIPATCDDPKYIIIIDDPNDPAPTPDSYAANNTIYEELTRVGNEFDPTFNVLFYRAVWFDGLEAYDPTHYDVGPTGNVIPNVVLIDGTIVTAQYIKAA